eukprot:13171-Heterococcus_DN1.PRE.1
MRAVMVREVQQYLHRPGLAPKALYAGVIFLNQVYLKAGEDAALANELVGTYFRLFERAVQAEDMRTRLLSALLTGVNRAHPYLAKGAGALTEHIDQLFKTVHSTGFNTSTQALLLIFHVVKSDTPSHSRPKPGTTSTTKAASSSTDDASTAAGAAAAVAESPLVTRFYNALYAKLGDADLRQAHQPALFLNLVYRALKADTVMDRVTACSKKLLQVAAHSPPPLAAACLFVISEVLKKHQHLRAKLFTAPDTTATAADTAATGSSDTSDNDDDSTADNSNSEKPITAAVPGSIIAGYDPQKRDPRFAFSSTASSGNGQQAGQAQFQPLWEVTLLKWHYHPSVQHFATQLLTPPGYGIRYRGDPLTDFGLMPFLDKLAYKNPKARKSGVKGMQRGTPKQHVSDSSADKDPVNAASFVSQPLETVGADGAFFHRFFREKAHRDGIKDSARRSAAASAAGEVSSKR